MKWHWHVWSMLAAVCVLCVKNAISCCEKKVFLDVSLPRSTSSFTKTPSIWNLLWSTSSPSVSISLAGRDHETHYYQ